MEQWIIDALKYVGSSSASFVFAFILIKFIREKQLQEAESEKNRWRDLVAVFEKTQAQNIEVHREESQRNHAVLTDLTNALNSLSYQNVKLNERVAVIESNQKDIRENINHGFGTIHRRIDLGLTANSSKLPMGGTSPKPLEDK